MNGKLVKLKIGAYANNKYEGAPAETFEVMFNPASYSQKYEVVYSDAQGAGTSGNAQKFGKIKPQEYAFEFLFDGTGVAGEKKDVGGEIEKFLRVAGKMDSDKHRPLYLWISWGTLQSKCVLKSAGITYTLFYPDGSPLRAKVNAVFSEDIEDKRRAKKEGKTSPDLTHTRTVKQGDTLPLMAYRIYGDPSYYMDVARFNGLTNFRKLEAGQTIAFPPIKSKSAASSGGGGA